MSDNASCPTTSSLPSCHRPRPRLRAFSFSVDARSMRVERSAGASPKRIVVRAETDAVKASTDILGCTSTSNGIGLGPPDASRDDRRLPHPASIRLAHAAADALFVYIQSNVIPLLSKT